MKKFGMLRLKEIQQEANMSYTEMRKIVGGAENTTQPCWVCFCVINGNRLSGNLWVCGEDGQKNMAKDCKTNVGGATLVCDLEGEHIWP